MFCAQDYNVTQRAYSKQGKRLAKYSKGQQLRDVLILRAQHSSNEWITGKEMLENRQTGPFNRTKSVDKTDFKAKIAKMPSKPTYKSPDNLLSKVPINATVTSGGQILKTGSNTPMSTSINDDLNTSKNDIEVMTMSTSTLNLNKMAGDSTTRNVLVNKNIYNTALDAFHLIDHCKGFLNKDSVGSTATSGENNLGVYCIRWRRSGTNVENETKLLVNGLDIVDAPLNIYCYFEEKVYVKMPMTLTITLFNTSSTTMHLKSYLKNTENFMFAGNTQVCSLCEEGLGGIK